MLTKDFLINEYKKGKQIRELAKELGCSTATITLANKKYEISAKQYNPKYRFMDKEWLHEQFNKFKTVSSVAENTGYPRTSITRWAEKHSIREKKFERLPTNSVDENYFSDIDDSNKAYILGFIMADGNMYKYDNGRLQLSIKVKDCDIDVIEKICEKINFDKKHIVHRTSIRNSTECNSVEIKVYNNTICNNLIKHCIVPRKSGIEEIPCSVPKELYKDFIRGFIDGDGWIYDYSYYKMIGVCSSSKKIVEQITEYFCSEYGINLNITSHKGLYRIQTSSMYKVKTLIKELYQDSELYLDRKYSTAMNILSRSAIN